MIRGMELLCHDERLSVLELFSLRGERRLQGHIIEAFWYLKGHLIRALERRRERTFYTDSS